MKRLFLHLVVIAAGIAFSAHFVPGVHVGSWTALALAAIALGLVNALVRPVLAFLSFPITVLSLGIFYLFVNAASFGLAALLVPGFRVDGVGPAVLGALATSLVSWFLGLFVDDDEPRKKRKKS